MKRVWKVKKRKFLRDKKGRVIGRPGELFPEDNADAIASPHAVVLIADPHEKTVDTAIVEDEESKPLDEFDPDWNHGN